MREHRWTATIVDISQGGLRIHLQRRFERGTPLAIELPGATPDDASVVFAKVVHVQATENGRWALGCKFISDLGDDEVQRLVGRDQCLISNPINHASKSEESPTRGSASPKHILDNVTIVIRSGTASTRRCFFKRLDVTNSWPLLNGTFLSIRGRAKDRKEWVFRIQITQASQRNGAWHLDAQG